MALKVYTQGGEQSAEQMKEYLTPTVITATPVIFIDLGPSGTTRKKTAEDGFQNIYWQIVVSLFYNS